MRDLPWADEFDPQPLTAYLEMRKVAAETDAREHARLADVARSEANLVARLLIARAADEQRAMRAIGYVVIDTWLNQQGQPARDGEQNRIVIDGLPSEDVASQVIALLPDHENGRYEIDEAARYVPEAAATTIIVNNERFLPAGWGENDA